MVQANNQAFWDSGRQVDVTTKNYFDYNLDEYLTTQKTLSMNSIIWVIIGQKGNHSWLPIFGNNVDDILSLETHVQPTHNQEVEWGIKEPMIQTKAISWSSKRQLVVVLSSTKSEYMSAFQAT